MERAIRKTKRRLLMKEAELKGFPNNPNLLDEYDKLSYRLRLQNREYGSFCAEHDLTKQYDRVKIAGFGRDNSKKANGRATSYEKKLEKEE